ncbi:MAG TPA: hypothetical protein VFS20_16320 [Longimicrobium sp.]|nr:hypothetical protein [Longimicrobium sp.]
MKKPFAVLALTVAALSPVAATAQSKFLTASADISAAVPINAYLNLSTSTITIPQPTAADVSAGMSKPAVVTLSYGANAPISLGYRFTTGPNLTGAQTGTPLSVGRLRLAVDGGPAEVMPEFMNAWRSGIPAGDHTETLSLALALDYSVKPDQYGGATLEFTLTAN